MKAVIMWENKDKTHGLENSVFKATTAVKVLQKSMLNIDPTVTLPDHLDDLCTLLRRAITNPNTVKKGAIQSVITGIRKHIVSLNKTGAFHLVKFIEQFILPIISTNVQMTVVLETTCQACGINFDNFINHKILILHANDVHSDRDFTTQILVSSNRNRECPNSKDNDTIQLLKMSICVFPKVLFVFKNQVDKNKNNDSYLEYLNLNATAADTILCVQYHCMYRLVSAVYRTNDDQYASITLRNTNKYICEGEGEGGFGIGEC
ncbi:unnamed protein product [Didymodactylos carnosus]|uniref:Uncharacterized protein n=1 Tax=Didymodactylos carnosus TaxID=1234261 RepID=A0A8S2FMH3_9BILA|nr:unnamed protein product [Didymodactylos carnosus]CAF4293106.1 unnamed protein product [Didymodactylos carnosus]